MKSWNTDQDRLPSSLPVVKGNTSILYDELEGWDKPKRKEVVMMAFVPRNSTILEYDQETQS